MRSQSTKRRAFRRRQRPPSPALRRPGSPSSWSRWSPGRSRTGTRPSALSRFIDALILEEIEDDLLELCGVRPGSDPREGWLATVKERLSSDLAQFRADVEGERNQIEQWSFRDGLVLASVGAMDEEADPDSGHGWMCRLADSGALAAAGFARVRKAEL
jgi:hypothetical protein